MYYFTLVWLFFNYLKYCYSSSSSSILTFSDMLNTKYETIINNNNNSSNYSLLLLRNTLNNTPTYNEILSDILTNMAKSNSYSYEFTNFYFTCEQAFNLLDSNTTTTNRSVISHDLIDCEYYLETNTFLNTNNNLNMYSLSATSLQIVEVIVGIVKTCSYPSYAIVYAKDTFFTEMTQIIVNKLIYSNVNNNNNNIAKNNLIFSIPINDLNLENLIFSNSNIKSN